MSSTYSQSAIDQQYIDTGYNARITALENKCEDMQSLLSYMEKHLYGRGFSVKKENHTIVPKLIEGGTGPRMRSNVATILEMKSFIERCLVLDDLGQFLSAEARDDARDALGMRRVES